MHRAEVSFGKYLDFQHGPVLVDARKSWGPGMGQLRHLLADVAKSALNKAPPQAALCHDIQRALPWIRDNIKRPIISRHELPGLVAQGLSSWWQSFNECVLQSHSDLLAAALRQMSDACEILSFDAPGLKDVLVVNPSWLLHDVVGILLSPTKFPPPHVRYDKNGRAKRKRMETVLKANFGSLLDHGETLHMVAEIGLCILDGNQQTSGGDGDVIVPSKLEISRNLQAVLLPQHLAAIWFGVELLCSEVPLSVCLLPQLQVFLHTYLLQHCKQKPIMWSSGIAVALSHEHVVGIVEARRSRMAIDIIVQGTEATRRTCFCLLRALKEQTLLKAQQFSPGSDITEMILSSRELSSLDWSEGHQVPRITYGRSYAEEAIGWGQIRPQHEDENLCALEDAYNLMAVPPTHVSLMTTDGYRRFCFAMNCSFSTGGKTARWQQLARRLRMPRHERPSTETSRMTNPTGAVLQWWSRRSAESTIERLLAAVKGMHHAEAAAILEKELTYSMDILTGDPEPASELEGSDGSLDEGDVASPLVLHPTPVEEHHSSPAPVDKHASPTTVRDIYSDPVQSVIDHSGSSVVPVQEQRSLPASPLSGTEEHWSPSVFLTGRDQSPDSRQEDISPSTLGTEDGLSSAIVKEHQFAQTSAPAAGFPDRHLSSPHARDRRPLLSHAQERRGPRQRSKSAPIPGHVETKYFSSSGSLEGHDSLPVSSPAAAVGHDSPPLPPSALNCRALAEHIDSEHINDHSPPLDSDMEGSSPPGLALVMELCSLTQETKENSAGLGAADKEDQAATAGKIQSTQTMQPGIAICGGHLQVNQTSCSVKEGRHEDAALADARILKVANTFYDSFECKQLAVYLQISQGGRIVSALHSTNPRMAPRDMAYEIMMTWRREQGSAATSEELRHVLRYKMKKVDAVELVWPIDTAMVTSDDLQMISEPSMEVHHGPAKCTYRFTDKVPEMVVMDLVLSSEFSEDCSCEHLAVFLEISKGSEFVVHSSPHASNREKAYDVMMEWRKEQGANATGEELYNVLRSDLKMEGLASQLKAVFRPSTATRSA